MVNSYPLYTYADKNNHLPLHRGRLSSFKISHPNGKAIALQYIFPDLSPSDIIHHSLKRIKARGEDHPCLKASNPRLEQVVEMFVREMIPVDLRMREDSWLDGVIEINGMESIADGLKRVWKGMGWEWGVKEEKLVMGINRL